MALGSPPNWAEMLTVVLLIVSAFVIPGVIGLVTMIRRQDRVESKIDHFIDKHHAVEQDLKEARTATEERFHALEARIDRRFDDIEVRMRAQEKRA